MKLRIAMLIVCGLLTTPLLADRQPDDKEYEKFTEGISDLAGDIGQYIKGEKDANNRVHVGAFQGPSEGGPVIQLHLADAMKEHVDVTKIKKGNYFVTGSFSQLEEDGKFYTVITTTVRNTQGKDVHTVPRRLITEKRLAIELFQPPSLDNTEAALPKEEQTVAPGEDPTTKPISIKKRADENLAKKLSEDPKPPAIVPTKTKEGKQVRIAKYSDSSPYGVELLVKDKGASSYESVPLEIDGSLALADLTPDQVYAIRVHNDTPHLVAVSITIDGVNIFRFSENEHFRTLGKVVIRPGGGTLKGWHKQGRIVNEFKIGEYGETAAAQLGIVQNLGTITVTFFPASEGKDFGTVSGKEIDGGMNKVNVEIQDSILGALSISYLKEGIVPANLPPAID